MRLTSWATIRGARWKPDELLSGLERDKAVVVALVPRAHVHFVKSSKLQTNTACVVCSCGAIGLGDIGARRTGLYMAPRWQG